jgi:hypothetical protein
MGEHRPWTSISKSRRSSASTSRQSVRWIETLKTLEQAEAFAWEHGRAKGRGLLDPVGRDALVARDLVFPRLGEDFEWTTG